MYKLQEAVCPAIACNDPQPFKVVINFHNKAIMISLNEV